MAMTACLGLCVKRKNVSSRGSPLLRISCTLYLGKQLDYDFSWYPKPQAKFLSAESENVSVVNRTMNNNSCHILPKFTNYNYGSLSLSTRCTSLFIFLPIFV
jgi:hypothetical protein